jgi:4-oxalocrotonate tautomerase
MVSMFPGRTQEQKRALVEEMTEAFLRTCGGNRDGIWIVIEEVPREHWAVGGLLSSDSKPEPRPEPRADR